MSMMISGGLVVCPAEIVSAASSHPPVRPCAISSPRCWGVGWWVGGDGTLATGGSIRSEARSEHTSTPRTCVHSTTLAHPSTPPAASGCLGTCLPATSTRWWWRRAPRRADGTWASSIASPRRASRAVCRSSRSSSRSVSWRFAWRCIDMCYQKSVSTALDQCLTRKREERSKFWKAVTQYKSIQSSEEDSSSCLVCQLPKQRLMLCHCFSVLLLMRRYWRCTVQLALPLALHDFLSALDTVSSHFRVRHWSDTVEKLFCDNT